MSTATTREMHVGVRAVTGERTGRLTWASAGAVEAADLTRGSRVLVHDGAGDWLGEVVVVPGQLLESPPLTDAPAILRLVNEYDAWPSVPDRAGWALLDSLDLPPALLDSSAT